MRPSDTLRRTCPERSRATFPSSQQRVDRLGATFATVDGGVYAVGDVDVEFPIQSTSKPFTYALALADRGFDAVLAKVGVEPSGEEVVRRLTLDGHSVYLIDPKFTVPDPDPGDGG